LFVKYLLCGVTELQRLQFPRRKASDTNRMRRPTYDYWIWHKATIRRVVARDRPCERRRDKMSDIVSRVCTITRLNGDAGNARITSLRSEYRSRSLHEKKKRERESVPMSAFTKRCEKRGSIRVHANFYRSLVTTTRVRSIHPAILIKTIVAWFIVPISQAGCIMNLTKGWSDCKK